MRGGVTIRRQPMDREAAAIVLFDTFGTPHEAAQALVLRAEAALRGLTYVRPHFRTRPTRRRKPS